jgi:hypothetical protein
MVVPHLKVGALNGVGRRRLKRIENLIVDVGANNNDDYDDSDDGSLSSVDEL